MATQIVLSWSVSTAGTTRTPAQAQAQLAAVPLFQNPVTDPVLGQNFALTVASDETVATGTGAQRTLTLNMTSVLGPPFAPPPFPCNPITSTPPVPPYPLVKTTTLPGAFLTVPGSAIVDTSLTQVPSLPPNSVVQFLAQIGVFYVVQSIFPDHIVLKTPYTGDRVAENGAVLVKAAPAKIAAVWSTSPLDTAGNPNVVPPIPPGSGAQSVSISYLDSTGAGPFTVVVPLQGKFPTAVVLAAGSLDIAVVTDMHIASAGQFANSVGQITLVEASSLPTTVLETPFPPRLTATDNTSRLALQRLQDQRMNNITRSLVYLPPSFFALTQQQNSAPMLQGDFLVTTGSNSVPTTVDQTAALAPGNTIQFASQLETDTPFGALPVFYTIKSVTPKLVILNETYTGLDLFHRPERPEWGNTKGTIGTEVQNLPTAASLIIPSPATPPTDQQLKAPLSQSVTPGNAVPPPEPPQPDQPLDIRVLVSNLSRPAGATSGIDPRPNPPPRPATFAPTPTLLSDLFTQTIQLALAGVPVVPAPVALL